MFITALASTKLLLRITVRECVKKKNRSKTMMEGYDFTRRLWRLYCSSSSWESAARALEDVRFEDLEAATLHPDPNIRLIAVKLMCSLGDARAIPVLSKLKGDYESNVPSSLQCDDDEPVQTLANAANEAICRLKSKIGGVSSPFRD
jgi:hypothetical protein